MCVALEDVSNHVESLVDYRNDFELHCEIGMTPKEAWQKAIEEGRNKLRAIPDDGWWELVWSEWLRAIVGPRGRIPFGGHFYPTECASGTRIWLCHHIDGSMSAVLRKPDHGVRPVILFSNNPRVWKG